MLGMFRMNATNTPKIAKVLQRYNLREMPEAHIYLKINNRIEDFTTPYSSPTDFLPYLIEEIEINPDDISDFKINYHKKFIRNYLQANPDIKFNEKEFWLIREACIEALQETGGG